jgi:hypothetical protein
VTNQTQERTYASPLTCGRRSRTGHIRQTCSKALNVLVDEGLLIRYPGLGYYVVGSPAKPGSPASGPVTPDAP